MVLTLLRDIVKLIFERSELNQWINESLLCRQRVYPLLNSDRISFIYQLMVSQTCFNAAQTRSARCLAEYRHPCTGQICASDLSQCGLAANRFSQLYRETIFGQSPDVGKW